MGHQSLIVVAGILLLAAAVTANLARKNAEMGVNSENSLARAKARELNSANMDMAMRLLADDSKRRSPVSSTNMFGGQSTVTFRDSVVGQDSLVVTTGRTSCVVGGDTGKAESYVVVLPRGGFVPLTVRGAVTTFGPIDDLIGDMYIDGREHDLNNQVIPGKGIFAVSTGAATFTNKIGAYLGGSYRSGGLTYDHAPTLAVNRSIIETRSQWPNGWPNTPDKALGLPEGTLKSIALSGVDGSQYITSKSSWPKVRVPNQPVSEFTLAPPMKGVTYIELPPGTRWDNIAIRKNSEGVLVFHSSATNAYLYRIAMEGDDMAAKFKGLMVFDRIFHIHINVLGGLIHLSPNTVVDDCPGNKDHWINYSSGAIMNATKIRSKARGAWRNVLAVRSWLDKVESSSGKRKSNRGNSGR